MLLLQVMGATTMVGLSQRYGNNYKTRVSTPKLGTKPRQRQKTKHNECAEASA